MGVILGIISMGDIWRAHDAEKDFVRVNKRFTKLTTGWYVEDGKTIIIVIKNMLHQI
jgi:hypothetical protein